MRIVEAISISIATLRSNKLRSLLTMLGIIIAPPIEALRAE